MTMAMARPIAVVMASLLVFTSFLAQGVPVASSASAASSSAVGVSSNSILVALLDSGHTEFSELVEKASLLQPLERVVSRTNVTVFAPRNGFLDSGVDPDFRTFLLEPRNLASLQKLLRHHFVPSRIPATEMEWDKRKSSGTLSDSVEFVRKDRKLLVGLSEIIKRDAITRPDGIVHSVNRLLVPDSVQSEYSAWKSNGGVSLAAIKPEAAPTLKQFLAGELKDKLVKVKVPSTAPSSPPSFSYYYALAPGPSLAPAPAPGPSSGRSWFNGDAFVADFIYTLVHYGGYNEMADLLVNLTSLAPELAKLVSEGYRITVLAPNDEAMSKLTAEHLTEPGAPEQILYYHIIPEYQTEESFYNSVRKFGRVSFETLRVPHKVLAQEVDGTVSFGNGAHLYDHDIYVDGRISVQGIDKVLMPPVDTPTTAASSSSSSSKSAKNRNLYEEDFDAEDDENDFETDVRGGFFSGLLCKLGLRQSASCN